MDYDRPHPFPHGVDMQCPQKQAPKEEKKNQISPWRLVEGDAKSIAKSIQKALEQSGEKRLTVEFRVFIVSVSQTKHASQK